MAGQVCFFGLAEARLGCPLSVVALNLIIVPERPANLAWGDADNKTLYITARTGLYQVRTLTGGKPAGR